MYAQCSCQVVSYINLFTIQERLHHSHREVLTIPWTEASKPLDIVIREFIAQSQQHIPKLTLKYLTLGYVFDYI